VVWLVKEMICLFYEDKLIPKNNPYRKYVLYLGSLLVKPMLTIAIYMGADNSLARPGTKQATETEDFDFDVSYL
jgi:hypothetical protein